MNKLLSFFACCITCCSFSLGSTAQCASGETPVTIVIETDNYGYEGYWELTPAGNPCGTGALASGGNATQIGCSGGGAPYTATAGNGYASNATLSSSVLCLTTGSSYSIQYVDDYGDGGFTFKVMIGGFPVHVFRGPGSGLGTTFTFTAAPPPAFDVSVTKIAMPMYGQPGAKTVAGTLYNYGSTTITSFDLNYSVNGGSAVTQTVTGVSIPGFTAYSFTHSTPWNPSANGTYNVDVWATNLNGTSPDLNTGNDHDTFTYVVGPATPNVIDDYLQSNHTFTTIASVGNGVQMPRDLDFHPVLSRNELWVVLKSTEASGGKTVKISNAGSSSQSALVQQDGNAWHFMSLPTGIAFSDNGNFCTSPGVQDANHSGGYYTGPALWSSNPTIYAQPSGGNGSHLDMLHQCPYSMGVAWEKENVFWVFDSYYGDLMRNDFGKDHGAGNDDHSDGRIRSYKDFSIARINLDIPCHLALDEAKKWLYVVDAGNSRILRMDITTGSQTATWMPYANEPLAETSTYTGTTWSTFLNTGTMQPSGADVIGNRLIVSDYATGDIHIYDCSGPTAVYKGKIQTGAPGVQGVKIGPDGKVWYVNYLTNKVGRVDYTLWPASVSNIAKQQATIFPNPASNSFTIRTNGGTGLSAVTVTDVTGRQVYSSQMQAAELTVDVRNWAKGLYMVSVSDDGGTSVQKVVVQ